MSVIPGCHFGIIRGLKDGWGQFFFTFLKFPTVCRVDGIMITSMNIKKHMSASTWNFFYFSRGSPGIILGG